MLSFFVEGLPETKGSWRPLGRSRRTGKPVMISDNPRESAWAELVGWGARAALRNRIEPDKRRYSVELDFTLPAPGGRNGALNKRDLDKLMRSVLDALTGIIWLNDEQVDRAVLAKNVGERPGVNVAIHVVLL